MNQNGETRTIGTHRRRTPRFLIGAACSAISFLAVAAPVKGEHPLLRYLEMARASRDAVAQMRDYQATFEKQELVNGKMTNQKMLIKQRHDPFSVYLRFVGVNEGREVLYVDGKNKNRLMAHEGKGLKSWAGSVSIAPTSAQAMIDNRYPITEIGMLKMIEIVMAQWQAETASAEKETQVKYYPDSKINNIACSIIQSSHPQQRDYFKFQTTRVFIDKKTKLPVAVQQWGFPNEGSEPFLVEQYIYSDIKPNLGLGDADFDSRNRNYKF